MIIFSQAHEKTVYTDAYPPKEVRLGNENHLNDKSKFDNFTFFNSLNHSIGQSSSFLLT